MKHGVSDLESNRIGFGLGRDVVIGDRVVVVDGQMGRGGREEADCGGMDGWFGEGR